MQDILSCLIELQKIDLQIYHLAQERNLFPEKVEALKKEIKKQKGVIQHCQEELETILLEKTTKEVLLKEQETHLNKWEKRLMESQNPREAAPLAREIDTQKRLNLEAQEEVLLLFEKEERQKEIIQKETSLLQELEKKLQTEEEICGAKVKGFDQKIGTFEGQRNQFSVEIKNSLLLKYEKIRDRREGLAIVEARDGFCIGCNMKLRPQLYNQIQTMSKMLTCPNCQRILYWQPSDDELITHES